MHRLCLSFRGGGYGRDIRSHGSQLCLDLHVVGEGGAHHLDNVFVYRRERIDEELYLLTI